MNVNKNRENKKFQLTAQDDSLNSDFCAHVAKAGQS